MSSRTRSPKADERGTVRCECASTNVPGIIAAFPPSILPMIALPFCPPEKALHPALKSTHHRPWPVPTGPWIMQQIWNDLLFAHWPLPPETLRPLVPSVLPLDTFNGQCWVALTPFYMTGVRPRLSPVVPGLSAFPELNVRTYVTYGGKSGVFFF